MWLNDMGVALGSGRGLNMWALLVRWVWIMEVGVA